MEFRSKPETILIDKYEILLKQVFTFAGFRGDQNVLEMSNGIFVCEPGKGFYTYGAGPCGAGISITEVPHFFHVNPNQFYEDIPEIDQAQGGIYGGSQKTFAEMHPNLKKFRFVKAYPLNIGMQNLGNNKLVVFYQ